MNAGPPYDPGARRDTPLARKLKARIASEGPLPLPQYIRACHFDPEHGYYLTRPVIGAKGDFVTAPEISQIFGELIGLWCAVVWQAMGSPKTLDLFELGPGRGTLMQDILRVAKKVPGFYEALVVNLIETHPGLRQLQQQSLVRETAPISWPANIESALTRRERPSPAQGIPPSGHIVVANEFIDTLPVRHMVRRGDAWRERCVALDERGELTFIDGSRAPDRPPADLDHASREGTIYEQCPEHAQALDGVQPLQQLGPTAWLFLDYGHLASTLGDTLQAVRVHAFEHPLCSPGEADLSAHVDFQGFAELGQSHGLATDGPVTQAEFLGSLGIMQRASRLMAANAAQANQIETGVARLMAPNGMGTRFKVLGLRTKDLPALPGFPTNTSP